MSRILTGIQSTGTPHLGNILGAIAPSIEMANNPDNTSFLFIADMHSLTQIKDGKELRMNTYKTAAAWLAFGLNIEKTIFYRQSDVPQVAELSWYLNCFFPYQRLTLAHGFKDKSERLEDVNCGLFTYPLLMAADILLYDAELVPVGKDQLQHLEMARDIATRFNHKMGKTLVPPKAVITEETMLIPGTDGVKMSKSKNNFLDIFLPEKQLRKQVMKIQTDSTPVASPKNTENCNLFKLYKVVASEKQVSEMAKKYSEGNYGYGEAKQALFELLIHKYQPQRALFDHYLANLDEIDKALLIGAEKARKIANSCLQRVREKIGY
jgi:tryptophanyl-tRNA synthetase